MPALATVVTDYIDRVSGALAQGTDFSGGLYGAPQNFALAMDMANILIILQEALSDSTQLAASAGGTTTTMVFAAATFDVNSQVGNVVTFEADTTTAALQGVTATVLSNTATTLTFTTALPAATVLGDEITIRAAFLDDLIVNINGSGAKAVAPTGNPYGAARLVMEGLQRILDRLSTTVLQRYAKFDGQAATGSTTTDIYLQMRGSSFVPGELVGLTLQSPDGRSEVVYNDADGLVQVEGLPLAPDPADPIVIGLAAQDNGPVQHRNFHPGGQPGDNQYLAYLLDAVTAAVTAYTLPA